VYIEVDNIDAYREKAKKHGGNAGETKKQISNLGWVAFVTDPNGNLIGLVQRAG
jgi:predicted enzyme related to lactoylglutathione lyase